MSSIDISQSLPCALATANSRPSPAAPKGYSSKIKIAWTALTSALSIRPFHIVPNSAPSKAARPNSVRLTGLAGPWDFPLFTISAEIRGCKSGRPAPKNTSKIN